MPEPSMLQVVLMGLITVFIALICLIIIIVILGKIMVAVTGNKASQPTPAPASAPAAPVAAPAPAAQSNHRAGSAGWQPAAGGGHCGSHC